MYKNCLCRLFFFLIKIKDKINRYFERLYYIRSQEVYITFRNEFT